MNVRAVQLMEKGTAKKQKVVVKKTVTKTTTRYARSKRCAICNFRRLGACIVCVAIIIVAVLGGLVLSYKDPKVSYNDFEFTRFDVEMLPILNIPYKLKVAWDCHFTLDNSDNAFHMSTEPTKVYLKYGKDTTIDEVDLQALELKASSSVIETVSHSRDWEIKDIPNIVSMAADWLAGKDMEYHLMTDLKTKVLFVQKDVKIDCSVIIKGRSLSLKQKMKCDVQYF